jgi:threonine dehydrogenase-like Zn-dependent dehydrogenase
MELTGGRGPDGCIDAVGTEADVSSLDSIVDRAKVASYIGTDCPHVLREAIMCCRKRGTVSIPGAAMNKGLTLKMGQTHVQKYLEPLLVRSKLAKSTRRS